MYIYIYIYIYMYIHARTLTWVIEKELPSFAVENFVNFET